MVAHGEEYWIVPKELVTALVDHQISLMGENLPDNPQTEAEKERVQKVRTKAKKKFKTFLDARRTDQGAMAQVLCMNIATTLLLFVKNALFLPDNLVPARAL